MSTASDATATSATLQVTDADAAGIAEAGERQALLGAALVLLSGVCYGGVTVLARVAHDHGSNAPSSLVARFGLAAVLFWVYLLLRRQPLRLPRGRLVGFLLMGVLFSVGALFSFMAVERIDAGLAALLIYTYPVLVAVASAVLFKLRLTRGRALLLLASLLGCLLTINVQAGAIDLLGVALASATAFTYTAYVLVGSRVTPGVSPLVASAWVITSGAVVALLVGATGAFGDSLTTDIDAIGWLAILALALVSTVVAISAFLAGMSRLDPVRTSILSTVEPAVSVVLAALLLGERLSAQQVLGGALIVSSAVLLQLLGRRRTRRTSTVRQPG